MRRRVGMSLLCTGGSYSSWVIKPGIILSAAEFQAERRISVRIGPRWIKSCFTFVRLQYALLCVLVHLHRAPRLVPSVTDILQQTLRALRIPRKAKPPPMPDDLMREQNPLFWRNDFHQVPF